MANKKRLIDANVIEKHCRNTKITELFPKWKDFTYATKLALIRYGKAWKEIIQNAPTVDAVEVVHGRWVSDEGDVLFHCSECETQISTSWDYDVLWWNYCPNCGAKMDK